VTPLPPTLAATSFDVAVPFLANALLLMLGPFIGLAIVARLRQVYRGWADQILVDPGSTEISSRPPLVNDPDQQAEIATWVIDAAQTSAIFLGPLVGLLLLRSRLENAVALLYVGSFLAAFAAFLSFTFLVAPDRYSRRGIWIFSPVTIIGVILNLAAAGAAAAVGP
jgi:hypothetical protein